MPVKKHSGMLNDSMLFFKSVIFSIVKRIIHEENKKEILSVKDESVYPDTEFC